MPTEERTTRNHIRNLLAASAALDLLFHSAGDSRGSDLAAQFEREAHKAWVELGYVDVPTFDLAGYVAEL